MSICCVERDRSELGVSSVLFLVFLSSFFIAPGTLPPAALSSTAPTATTQSSAQAPQGSTHPSIKITVQHSQPTDQALQAAEEHAGRGLPLQRACVAGWLLVVVVVVEIKYLVISEHQHPLGKDRLPQRYVGLSSAFAFLLSLI